MPRISKDIIIGRGETNLTDPRFMIQMEMYPSFQLFMSNQVIVYYWLYLIR